MAPTLGPIISGFSVPIKGWQWSEWELLWLSGPTLVLLFVTLPETSSDNILLRRARRLQKVAGNKRLKSQSEINQKHIHVSSVAFDALIKPWQINVLDSAVLFSTIYSSLTYSVLYCFFEAFPISYTGTYGFNTGESALPFVAAIIGMCIIPPIYVAHMRFIVEPRVARYGEGPPEQRLIPALYGCFLLPVGLFIFGTFARTPSLLD
jgi:DHA1 family multidrug resistance protein-like MFS transporter